MSSVVGFSSWLFFCRFCLGIWIFLILMFSFSWSISSNYSFSIFCKSSFLFLSCMFESVSFRIRSSEQLSLSSFIFVFKFAASDFNCTFSNWPSILIWYRFSIKHCVCSNSSVAGSPWMILTDISDVGFSILDLSGLLFSSSYCVSNRMNFLCSFSNSFLDIVLVLILHNSFIYFLVVSIALSIRVFSIFEFLWGHIREVAR